ncbi:1,2-phenylacetyl-CoA epoxidase subunit PaaE [Asanoa sp. NPDC049573]|uniref:1,2-phenylacetyl-CoA epoxidase subunit PaaE n=1 Tax=Asanoa sp. NPDC049573 TaxID=3155396 RepID=UPI00343D65C8
MSVTISRPTRRRPVFHPLPVAAIDRLTDDAVAITFAVPAELRDQFAFRAGQHLTVRKVDDDARRSYSICSTPSALERDGLLRIGVKEIPGGVFSSYAASALRSGDAIDVMPPLGKFTSPFEPGRRRHYGAIAAGSGITPVLSLIATALAVEEQSQFTLVYSNRFARSVMFVDELGDLKDRYAARLHVVHVLSQEPGESELLSGRIDADRLARLLDSLVPAEQVDEWFLCGPYGLVTDARNVLAGRGVTTVHTELFHVDDVPEPPRRASTADDAAPVEVSVLLDGRVSTLRMRRDERVLDAALRVRSELPFACKGGVCSTCRARIVEGEVTMARNYALEPDEVARGYVLTCQSSPVTDKLVVDYDG